MYRNKTLVFFGAHPDDESFGIGSTLAQYAAEGAKVYYVCSTGGEMGTVAPEFLEGHSSIRELREEELRCASEVLGLAGYFYLGYRDSGMQGAKENKHPDAMAAAPLEEITGRMVKILREIKPDVVVTHDSGGSYGHPDHIATNRGTTAAFQAAGDPERFPEAGEAFSPGKLYYAVRSRKLMKTMVRLMPLFGQDPHHYGRNGDVDLTKMMGIEYPIHAVVKLKKSSVETRNRAVACHGSQIGGGRRRFSLFTVMEIIGKLRGPRDCFMRAFPPPAGRREKDLFEGIS